MHLALIRVREIAVIAVALAKGLDNLVSVCSPESTLFVRLSHSF